MTSDKCGTWVETFPGNLRWTNATQIVKGMVPWAAAAAGEIDVVVQRLKGREHEADPDRAWRDEWGAMGERSLRSPTPRRRKGDRSPPATITCGPATTTTAPSASSRRATRRWRCTARRCAAIASLGAAASQRRGRRRPLRGTVARRLFHEGAWRHRPRAHGGAVRRHGQLQGDERHLRRPRVRQARHPYVGDRRAGPGRDAAAANIHSRPDYEVRGHRGLRIRRRAPRGRSEARRRDGLQLRRLSGAAHRGRTRSATRPASRSAPCIGASTNGRPR